MKTLFVYFENKRVGLLRKDEELTYSFEYADDWMANPEAFPLSLMMPLSEKRFANKVTLSFFENLLPEGEVRKRLEDSHRLQGPFDFLNEFGRDCAGAIVVTDNKNYRYRSNASARVELDMDKIYHAISEHESVAEAISEMNPGYLSLAGAQDKFAAIFANEKFYLPTQGGPTTHIVKVPIRRKGVKDSVYNEFYCMQLAQKIGLGVPETQLLDGEYPLFIVKRYDRQTANGQVRRLHQQDFCQAQGFTSASKYEAKGGPTIRQNFELLRSNITAKRRFADLERFLNWICFNLVIGNNDSHSKNISLRLSTSNRIELAPFYDLLSTAIYSTLQREFSFSIGDRTEFTQIGRKQLEKLEDQLELKRGKMSEQMTAVTKAIDNHKDEVAAAVLKLAPKAKIVARINDLIADRIKGLKNQRAL
jgi:serine/threonine-protein kinase HipA